MPWSSPSSLSPTLRCQHRRWTQQATSLPGWEHWGPVGGRRRAHLPGGSLGLGQAAAGGRVRAVRCNAGHRGPSPASAPLDTKGTFPCAKETPNPFLPHPILPGTLSPIPQPGPASMSGDMPSPPAEAPQPPSVLARVPSRRYSHQQLWHIGDEVSPQLQLVRDPPVWHISPPGEGSWGLKRQANPTELSFLFSSPPKKAISSAFRR